MIIYDSKEDVIETGFLRFGFLSLGLLMIMENLIASILIEWQSSNAVLRSLLVQWSDVYGCTLPLVPFLLRTLRKFEQDLVIPIMTVLAWLRYF